MNETGAVEAGTMVIKPEPQDWELAREVHALFAAKVGATHIASDFALAHLAALLRQRPITSVAEFGSGIGTITYLLLKRLPRGTRIVCAERDAWCRQQFDQNIPAAERDRIELMPEGRPVHRNTFDLIVIDGPIGQEAPFAHEGSIVFVEGNRATAWSRLQPDLARRGLACTLTHYPARGFRIRWRMSRFGLSLPSLGIQKGCWIGVVRRGGESPPHAA